MLAQLMHGVDEVCAGTLPGVATRLKEEDMVQGIALSQLKLATKKKCSSKQRRRARRRGGGGLLQAFLENTANVSDQNISES